MDGVILSDGVLFNIDAVVRAEAVTKGAVEPTLALWLGNKDSFFLKGEDARRIWVALGMGEWDGERGTFTTPFDEEGERG